MTDYMTACQGTADRVDLLETVGNGSLQGFAAVTNLESDKSKYEWRL